jgi:membrane protein YqaA with SNARE-associated domain
MKALFNALIGYFLTPLGVLLMGALDASLVFFLPLGIDFVVIIVTARRPEFFWLYALLATAGSLIGAGGTYWVGRKVGQHGLARLIKPSTLRRVERRVTHSAAMSIAALGIIPPPFPFTAFVLASGAFGLNPWTFLSALGGVRLARFLVEAGLAARYGSGILAWMESPTFTLVVTALAVLAVGGTIVSAIALIRAARSDRQMRNRSSAATPP